MNFLRVDLLSTVSIALRALAKNKLRASLTGPGNRDRRGGRDHAG